MNLRVFLSFFCKVLCVTAVYVSSVVTGESANNGPHTGRKLNLPRVRRILIGVQEKSRVVMGFMVFYQCGD